MIMSYHYLMVKLALMQKLSLIEIEHIQKILLSLMMYSSFQNKVMIQMMVLQKN